MNVLKDAVSLEGKLFRQWLNIKIVESDDCLCVSGTLSQFSEKIFFTFELILSFSHSEHLKLLFLTGSSRSDLCNSFKYRVLFLSSLTPVGIFMFLF